MNLSAGADDDGRRLDRILRKALPDLPLAGIHRLLRKGRVLVDGKPAAAEDRVAAGSIITVPDGAAASPPAHRPPQRPEASIHATRSRVPPQGSPDVLREEADILFINKPAGLAVHGPGGLDGRVRDYLADKTRPSLSFRPGPLHRLDKPTSGIIAFSKTLEGARSFSALIREGRITKQYLAVVDGVVNGPATWEDLLIRDQGEQKTFLAGKRKTGAGKAGAAKPARTGIRPLAVYTGGLKKGSGEKAVSLILAEIKTGRTHQIRAQAAAHGFPLAGDKKYGGAYQAGGFLLHAWKLEIPAQGEGKEPLRVTAPLPEIFTQKIRELFPRILV
jgi:23S rRNA pseudouridine955/2504/2580 synthase